MLVKSFFYATFYLHGWPLLHLWKRHVCKWFHIFGKLHLEHVQAYLDPPDSLKTLFRKFALPRLPPHTKPNTAQWQWYVLSVVPEVEENTWDGGLWAGLTPIIWYECVESIKWWTSESCFPLCLKEAAQYGTQGWRLPVDRIYIYAYTM